MKKTLLAVRKAGLCLFFAAFLPVASFAQKTTPAGNIHRCYTHEKMMELRDLNPAAYDKNKAKQEMIIQNWIAKKYQPGAKVIYTIPVVVQIFGATPNSQVTDNRVYEQIDVLNKDYRRLNSDTNLTPADFKSIAADCEIEFCLATIDPQGNATTGIVRKTSSTSPTSSDLWNTSQYLNLLVYSISGGVLGYTYLPSQAPNNGVHIGYQYFGKTGAASPYNKGRTATHEVGHWFNLEHTWADESACNADDGVSDTPQQKGENYGCPNYPQTTQAGGRCSSSDPSSMFMNYLDYTDDGCMNIFSAGQKARMISAINQYRPGLLNNGKCGTTAPTDDAGIESITQPSGNICSSSITPVVVLKNFGTQVLSTCTISYKIDSDAPLTYSWNGNLAAMASASVTLPSMAATGGIHTFTANTLNPNGSTDSNSSNDQASGSFSISTTGQAMPFTEGFEGSFIPAGWTLNNADGSTTWAKATAGFSGSASAFMDNYDYNASGQVDEMVSPAIDLTSGTSPNLTFQVAYQLYTDPGSSPNYSDTLEVLISADCGVSFTSLYKKFSSALTTVTPVFSISEFAPNGQGDWRMETISLAGYSSVNNAIIKFRHATDYENNLYIDDINISGGTNCNISATTSSVNPTCGQSDGSIAATAAGGSSPYAYLWSNGQTSATATGLASGNYSLIVTDANSCSDTVYVSLSSSGAPTVSAVTANVTCYGGSDGSVAVTATGGTSPYTFNWSTGATSSSITGLAAGTYSGTVTDANGCQSSGVANITQPTAISGSVTTVDASCDSSNGSASVTASGGTPGYNYLWSNGASGGSATGLAAGNYSVTVTDANNCSAVVVASVSNTNAPVVAAGSTDASAYGVCDGSASANATGGTSPYTYLWSNLDTTSGTTGLCAGTYNVTVTDASNCSGTASIVISQPSGINMFQVSGTGFRIYPNPGTGKFFIHGAGNEVSAIRIYNVLGEITLSLPQIARQEPLAIDLSNYPEGIYFVEINTGERSVLKKINIVK